MLYLSRILFFFSLLLIFRAPFLEITWASPARSERIVDDLLLRTRGLGNLRLEWTYLRVWFGASEATSPSQDSRFSHAHMHVSLYITYGVPYASWGRIYMIYCS